MKSIRWQKDNQGNYYSYLIKNNLIFFIKVYKNNKWEGFLLPNGTPNRVSIKGSNGVKIIEGKGSSLSKALLECEKALVNYLKLRK